MRHCRVMLEKVVNPEVLGKAFRPQVIDYSLDADAGIRAAFDEVTFKVHAMVSGTAQDIAPPDDRFVRFALDIRPPGVDKCLIFEHRIISTPGQKIVSKMHARIEDVIFAKSLDLFDEFRVRYAPNSWNEEHLGPVDRRIAEFRQTNVFEPPRHRVSPMGPSPLAAPATPRGAARRHARRARSRCRGRNALILPARRLEAASPGGASQPRTSRAAPRPGATASAPPAPAPRSR